MTPILSYLFHIVVSQGLSYLVFSGLFLLMWRTQRSQKYLLFWSVGFLFGSIGWLINLIPIEHVSTEQLFWFIDISITLVSVSAVTYGFFIRSFKSFNALWFFAAGFIALHWIAYFSSIKIDYGLKMAIGPLYIALCMQVIVYIMWLKNKRFSSLEWVAVLVCQTSVLVHAARAYLYSTQTIDAEQVLFSTYDIVSFLVLPMLYTATGAVLLLIGFHDKETSGTALIDHNNGMLNAKGLQEISRSLMWQCESSRQWVTVIICKVNHLKYIQQHYGHAITKQAMQSLAKALADSVDNRGYVGCIDNQEFIILLPLVDDVEADKWSTKLQFMASQLKINYKNELVPLSLVLGHASSCKNYNYDKLKSLAQETLTSSN